MTKIRPNESVNFLEEEAVIEFHKCLNNIDPSLLYNNQPISLKDTFNQYFEGRTIFLCLKYKNQNKQGNMDRLKKVLIFNI